MLRHDTPRGDWAYAPDLTQYDALAAPGVTAPLALPGGQLRLADYRRLAKLITEQSGIMMPDSKRTMVEGRLRKRLRALGIADFSAYCHYLFEQNGLATEHTALLDAVTTNKTEFFREPNHFVFLREEILPRLLSMPKRARPPKITVWSAASSTGAEAYSIAMELADRAQANPQFRFSVLGTDVSTEVLETAAAGIYPSDMTAPISREFLDRYVMRARDRSRELVRIVPELRQHVRFQHMNLMAPRYPVANDFDVIFCRNVLIYFHKKTQRDVLSRLCAHLRHGGYLILGHSESMAGAGLDLEQVAPTIFRRG